MSALPTKYVPIEHSQLGIAALAMEHLRPNDTISSLWERIKSDTHIRTFEQFADALTLMFAGGVISLDKGIIHTRTVERGRT